MLKDYHPGIYELVSAAALKADSLQYEDQTSNAHLPVHHTIRSTASNEIELMIMQILRNIFALAEYRSSFDPTREDVFYSLEILRDSAIHPTIRNNNPWELHSSAFSDDYLYAESSDDEDEMSDSDYAPSLASSSSSSIASDDDLELVDDQSEEMSQTDYDKFDGELIFSDISDSIYSTPLVAHTVEPSSMDIAFSGYINECAHKLKVPFLPNTLIAIIQSFLFHHVTLSFRNIPTSILTQRGIPPLGLLNQLRQVEDQLNAEKVHGLNAKQQCLTNQHKALSEELTQSSLLINTLRDLVSILKKPMHATDVATTSSADAAHILKREEPLIPVNLPVPLLPGKDNDKFETPRSMNLTFNNLALDTTAISINSVAAATVEHDDISSRLILFAEQLRVSEERNAALQVALQKECLAREELARKEKEWCSLLSQMNAIAGQERCYDASASRPRPLVPPDKAPQSRDVLELAPFEEALSGSKKRLYSSFAQSLAHNSKSSVQVLSRIEDEVLPSAGNTYRRSENYIEDIENRTPLLSRVRR